MTLYESHASYKSLAQVKIFKDIGPKKQAGAKKKKKESNKNTLATINVDKH